jgi:hypothetical protein
MAFLSAADASTLASKRLAGTQTIRGCRMTTRRWLLVVLGPALLAACTTPMFTMPPGPEAFRIGYRDGCDAGYAYAGSPFYEQSNVTAPPPATKDYTFGWHAGFEQCAANYQRMQRAVNVLLGPP